MCATRSGCVSGCQEFTANDETCINNDKTEENRKNGKLNNLLQHGMMLRG